jgi:hypothetical protein
LPPPIRPPTRLIDADLGTITTSEQSALFRPRHNADFGAASIRVCPNPQTCQKLLHQHGGLAVSPEPYLHKLLVPPDEAAVILSLGRTKVFELMATGQLSSVRIG